MDAEPKEFTPPPPPDGFREPTLIPNFTARKHLLTAVLFVSIHSALWPSLASAYLRAIAANPWNVFLAGAFIDGQFLGAMVVVSIVHEAIHVAFARRYGFETDYGIDWVGPYILIDEQWIPRREYKRMVIAPLAVITLGAGLGAALPFGHQTAVLCKLVLLVNTASASGDIIDYVLYRRKSPGTTFYNQVEKGSILTYAYPPAE